MLFVFRIRWEFEIERNRFLKILVIEMENFLDELNYKNSFIEWDRRLRREFFLRFIIGG